ncbi:MAG: dephospho-CoA kinase, partial [Clostridia bacterium]|nr:dephospho-CoA kinase [Clostridia bacterium]
MKRNAIALTGVIGSGKSAVGNYLRQKGFVVIDCDKLSREVANHWQVQQKVVQLLGAE